MIDEQYKQRVYNEVMKSATPENLNQAIREKKKELYALRAKRYGRKAVSVASKVARGIDKLMSGKFKNKEITKSSKVSVDVSQPVYSEDKSRFFKTAWKEEKRQLYFH